MNEILRVEDLCKDYSGPGETLHVLRGLNLSVKEGESVCITGESGNGKSTLLNILGGIDTGTSGKIFFDGMEVSAFNEDERTKYRAKSVGLVFQFHYLLKDFTALENVFLPAFMAGLSKKVAEEKAKHLLNEVGLSQRAGHLPSELSGGERQRVAVARALVNDPALVLADEPTGNLDPANAAMIGELLFKITAQYKKTLLLVTHDVQLAKRGSVLYCLKNGVLERQ